MSKITPDKEWWTASEIAEAGLKDLPDTRQGVEAMVKKMNWRSYPNIARRRSGRGGGWEYSWQVFPMRAQRQLLLQVSQPSISDPGGSVGLDRDAAWDWFDSLPDVAKEKAKERLLILQRVEALEPSVGRAKCSLRTLLRNMPRCAIWRW